MKPLRIEKHGVTLGFDKGVSLGITILTPDRITTAQVDLDDIQLIADYLSEEFGVTSKIDQASLDRINDLEKEVERVRQINESLVDRNEELRTGKPKKLTLE